MAFVGSYCPILIVETRCKNVIGIDIILEQTSHKIFSRRSNHCQRTMSTAIYLSSKPEMKRSCVEMTCPPPPGPMRRVLSFHSIVNGDISMIAPLPFDCRCAPRDSRVSKSDSTFGAEGSTCASLLRQTSKIQHEQQDGSSVNDTTTELYQLMMKVGVSLKSDATTATNNNCMTCAFESSSKLNEPTRRGSANSLKGGRKRLSFCNSAA